MKNISKYCILIFSFIILISCDSKYHKKNDKWYWKHFHGGNMEFVYTEIDSINPEKFSVISDNYGKDENFVFQKYLLISRADPSTFEIINNKGYAKDKNHVFLDDEIIIFANPDSFELLEFPYSKDDSHVFCGTLPLSLEKHEIAEFKVTKSETSRSSVLLSHFVEINPEYKWLDSLEINGIIIGRDATGQTNNKKFKGFIEIKK